LIAITDIKENSMTRNRLAFTLAAILLGFTVIIAVSTGRYPIALSTLGRLFLSLIGLQDQRVLLAEPSLVLWSVRMPRILMAIMTGAALSVSGVIFQGLFKNPLVSPAILGVTSGANFGAALALLFWGSSIMILEASAFI